MYVEYINSNKTIVIQKLKQNLKNGEIAIEDYKVEMQKLMNKVTEIDQKMRVLYELIKS